GVFRRVGQDRHPRPPRLCLPDRLHCGPDYWGGARRRTVPPLFAPALPRSFRQERRLMRRVLFSCLVSLAAAHSALADSTKYSPDLPYQARKGNPVTYDVDFSVVITPPYHTKLLKVWFSLPQTDVGQEVKE